MSSPRKFTIQTVTLIIIIAVAAIALGVNTAYSYIGNQSNQSEHKLTVRIDGNGALSVKQAAHSECRAQRSSALDDRRWAIIFELLGDQNATTAAVTAAGKRGRALPSIDTLTNKGGKVGGVVFKPCPPSIAPTKGSKP